jgi:hypothetical protein
MSKMILFRPLPIASLTGDVPVQNLLTAEPKEVIVHPPFFGALGLHVDFGAPRSIDSIFLGFMRNYAAGHGVQHVTAGLGGPNETILFTLNGPGGMAPTASEEPLRRHWFVKLPAPADYRYISFQLGPGAGEPVGATIGILAIGKALQTSFNREKGGGRTIIDTGAKEARQDGGFGTGHGTVKAGFRWTWGDLSDAEVEAIYDLGLWAGERRPIVVVEDPDQTPGLNERIHYGLFDKFEAYERGDPSKHRWALSVTQWV